MRLPRSGRWMRWVQIALGLLVIYFAGTYYFKAMAAWRIETGPALAIAALSMLALAAGILLQRREIALHVRTLRSLPAGLVVLAAAVALHLSGWIGAPQPPQLPPERIGNLLWLRDRDQAFGQARESGRLLFVDFFAEWCSNCHAFQETVQENQALNQALQSAVLYKVDDRDPVFQSFQEDPRFPELLIGLPFFVIFDAEGNVLYQTTNYLASAEMIAHLKQNVAPPPSVERR